MEHWIDIRRDDRWVAGKYKKGGKVKWSSKSLRSLKCTLGPNVSLRARHRRDIMLFLQQYLDVAVTARDLDMHVRASLWARKHSQSGPWVPGSLPGSGLAKAIGDKLQHRYVLHFCEGTDHERAGLIKTIPAGSTIHFGGLRKDVSSFLKNMKGAGGGTDAALDVIGAIVENF